MVKQDAMNVFLGFYIPSETSMHLWDLDSDYYLHNRYLRPPAPYINRILYEQNRLNRSNSSLNRFEMKNAVSRRSLTKHSKIAKKYFIQSRDFLKVKTREKVERIEGVEESEKGPQMSIENESESEDEKVEGRDKSVPVEDREGDEEDAIGEHNSPSLVLSSPHLPNLRSSPLPFPPHLTSPHHTSLLHTPPLYFLH